MFAFYFCCLFLKDCSIKKNSCSCRTVIIVDLLPSVLSLYLPLLFNTVCSFMTVKTKQLCRLETALLTFYWSLSLWSCLYFYISHYPGSQANIFHLFLVLYKSNYINVVSPVTWTSAVLKTLLLLGRKHSVESFEGLPTCFDNSCPRATPFIFKSNADSLLCSTATDERLDLCGGWWLSLIAYLIKQKYYWMHNSKKGKYISIFQTYNLPCSISHCPICANQYSQHFLQLLHKKPPWNCEQI